MNVLASSLALLNRIETYSFSSLSELAYSKLHPDDKDLPLDELAEKFTEVIKEQLQKK